MLEKSDRSVSGTLKHFNAFDLEVGLLVPTPTGLSKSIMDATASVRDYLLDTGFHDYARQDQGAENKVVRRAFYVLPDRLEETTVSLYRPNTKSGDPRIWFGKMKNFADPYNLLALLVHDGAIYLINCSRQEILDTLSDPSTPLGDLAARMRPTLDPAVSELLDMIREVSRMGYVPTLRPGDTGIGMTLETHLGISANNNRTPDYKGIEIKAKRMRGKRSTRVTLFSQVPNWKLSPIGSAWNLLSTYGYFRDGKLRLNHEIDANSPNSIGFQLELDAGRDWLKQNHVDRETLAKRHVTTWEMQTLRQRLTEKHPQTFWVGAKCRGTKHEEEFHYVQVEHTRTPRVRNFDALLEAGLVSVDYLMSQRTPGREVVRDHGYLFKMHAHDFDALFPASEVHVFS
ncbi:MvaI/BcnI family restriction endonuclease [Nitratireductor sp.]|uniref:MvaI/BcnI family restriction endonuclease n=1 Tax=Nitratireductor sp. TaxID=1872084 RepID=UPI00262C9A5D|nr:MvaI/BcnI family restriction endonuclease [Nitratireductor sp.]MCV0381744.1 hypothetical protein [Nitratireductor sp.]